MALIYLITNNVNGKMYVGKTLQPNVNKRFREHLRDSRRDKKRNRPLYAAIRKYGEGSFSVSVVEECAPGEASDREVFWINHYDTYRNGYNATLGGDGSLRLDHELLQSLLALDEDTTLICGVLGCCSDTVRKDARALGIDRTHKRQESLNRKPVDMLTPEGLCLRRFGSASEAGAYFGDRKKRAHILDCANGKRKTAYGYSWRFCAEES